MKRFLVLITFVMIFFSAFTYADTKVNLVGKWFVDWEGGKHNYKGFLYINKKISDSEYSGILDLTYGEGKNIKQDAIITLRPHDAVVINCMNPSQPDWNPDNFYLTLKDNIMHGNSRDSKGVTGHKIIIKKVD